MNAFKHLAARLRQLLSSNKGKQWAAREGSVFQGPGSATANSRYRICELTIDSKSSREDFAEAICVLPELPDLLDAIGDEDFERAKSLAGEILRRV